MRSVANRHGEEDGRDDDCNVGYDKERRAGLVQRPWCKGSGFGKAVACVDTSDDTKDEANCDYKFDQFQELGVNDGAMGSVDVVEQPRLKAQRREHKRREANVLKNCIACVQRNVGR